MFVDASALTAIIAHEEGWPDLSRRLEAGIGQSTSPIAVWETVVALARKLGIPPSAAQRLVDEYLPMARVAIIPIPSEAGSAAIDAFARFGKGRHPAALNMGDCFAYACARLRRVPLLYKGDDFALTDIERA